MRTVERHDHRVCNHRSRVRSRLSSHLATEDPRHPTTSETRAYLLDEAPTRRGRGTMATTTAPDIDDRTVTKDELKQVDRANSSGKQPVVFVHGLWLLPSSWDP